MLRVLKVEAKTCFPEDIRDEFTALAVLFAPAVAF